MDIANTLIEEFAHALREGRRVISCERFGQFATSLIAIIRNVIRQVVIFTLIKHIRFINFAKILNHTVSKYRITSKHCQRRSPEAHGGWRTADERQRAAVIAGRHQQQLNSLLHWLGPKAAGINKKNIEPTYKDANRPANALAF
jgi:hypothetical protein